jgi:hypothetical protein
VPHTASHEPQNTFALDANEDEIDLRLVAARIWNWRKFILTGTLIVITIALVTYEFFAKYQSEGYLQINNISPIAYRSYQPTLLNIDRFRAYATEVGLKDNQTVDFVAYMLSLPPDKFEKLATFVRSTTPKDSKDNIIGKDKDKDKEIATVYLGLELNIPGPSPEIAQLRSQLFADYFVDSLLYVDLTNWMDAAMLVLEAESYRTRVETIRIKRDILETEERLTGLRTIAKRYPDSARMDIRQVLSIDKTSERFLSPVAQIVAAESSVVDGNLKLSALVRKQKQIDLMYVFYHQVVEAKTTTVSGRELSKKLIAIGEGTFKNIGASNEMETEVVHEISHGIESRRLNYAIGFKFTSGPTLPESKTRKYLLSIAVGAGAGGVFFMVFFAILISWWRRNREFIIAQDGEAATAS